MENKKKPLFFPGSHAAFETNRLIFANADRADRERCSFLPDVVAVLPVDVALEAEAETALIVPQVSETAEGETKEKKGGERSSLASTQ